MVKLKLMLCADAVIRDAETNSISVFTIIQEIQVEAFPLFIPRFVVLCVLERAENDDQQITVTLEVSLGTMNIVNEPVSINFQDKKRNTAIITVGGLPLPKPGTLNIVLKLGDAVLGTYQIPVTVRETTVQVQQG